MFPLRAAAPLFFRETFIVPLPGTTLVIVICASFEPKFAALTNTADVAVIKLLVTVKTSTDPEAVVSPV